MAYAVIYPPGLIVAQRLCFRFTSDLNIHAMRMGPGKHLKGLTLMGGIVTPEEVSVPLPSSSPSQSCSDICLQFDYFHELVVTQEVARVGARGYGDGPSVSSSTFDLHQTDFMYHLGLQAGAVIGLPPVLNFGSPDLKAKVIPEVLSGKKFICLAISEAFAGSDVMGLQTTAKKSEDGKNWIINGTKKWITNGTFAD